MKVFVTGATGFIGSRLALRLAEDGLVVHALYRDTAKTSAISHPNLVWFKGDILDPDSLVAAVEGCSGIYHTAAFAKVWHKDTSVIYRLNIEGTMNVIMAGIQAGVKRVVCTSTAGVLGPSGSDSAVDENSLQPESFFTDYEASKSILEKTLNIIQKAGIEIVIVNPTRVYGPGVLSDSNGVTRMMQKYIAGKWHVIPGNGNSIGNYVYVEDVVTGHKLAMEKGRTGERYVLGGENLTYDELFRIMAEVSGKKYWMFHFPVPVMEFVAGMMLLVAKVSGIPPLIIPGLVRKYYHNWNVSSAKAKTELNYQPVGFQTGAAFTIEWLKTIR